MNPVTASEDVVERRPSAMTLTARSIARHLRDHRDEPETAGIIEALCDHIDAALNARPTVEDGPLVERLKRAMQSADACQFTSGGLGIFIDFEKLARAAIDALSQDDAALDMCAHGADRGSYCGYCGGYSKGANNG